MRNNRKIETNTPEKIVTKFKGISYTKNLKLITKLTNYEKDVIINTHTPKDQLLRPSTTSVL